MTSFNGRSVLVPVSASSFAVELGEFLKPDHLSWRWFLVFAGCLFHCAVILVIFEFSVCSRGCKIDVGEWGERSAEFYIGCWLSYKEREDHKTWRPKKDDIATYCREKGMPRS